VPRKFYYNPEKDPLRDIVDQVKLGNQVETPVLDRIEGEYIRQKLSRIFKLLQDEVMWSTGIHWDRPIPHLVQESWYIEPLKGEWKIKVDWEDRRRKRLIIGKRR
jgi:hypothetical protein